jgi:hypothetical protein
MGHRRRREGGFVIWRKHEIDCLAPVSHHFKGERIVPASNPTAKHGEMSPNLLTQG